MDGRHLADFLLSKGYAVHGLVRRHSSPREPIPGVTLHMGDMTDPASLRRVIEEVEPDEIYNLAAQSYVPVSFEKPAYTFETIANGTLHLLEACVGLNVRIYQASSSEMFGNSPAPQNEKTPFAPVSPYACAKVAAHELCKHYRRDRNMFVSCGILFNHETIAEYMPVIVKRDSEIDIIPIREAVAFDQTNRAYQQRPVSGLSIWGAHGWTSVRHASCYPHETLKDNKNPSIVSSRAGMYMATGNHVAFLSGGEEKQTQDIAPGDRMEVIGLPAPPDTDSLSTQEAELIGMMVADGSISYGTGIGVHGKFTKNSSALRDRFSELFASVANGRTRLTTCPSGFAPGQSTFQLQLAGGNDWLRTLDLYTEQHEKRIPRRVLNSGRATRMAFLRGYNACDGLKAGTGRREFKNFSTTSATLAMGLWYLARTTIPNQELTFWLDQKEDGRFYYRFNLCAERNGAVKQRVTQLMADYGISQREICRRTGLSRTFIRKIQRGGTHSNPARSKDHCEVTKNIPLPEYAGWFYDLETTTGEFHCGIGEIHVHNSPRRGEPFVTRKTTRAAGRIKAGLQDKLSLGNLEARRDWGFAGDYVKAMWLMLQQDDPDDFVIGTGEAHSVAEWVEAAFDALGMEPSDYVKYDPALLRPAEVHWLCADASKARRVLGWEPEVSFHDLVKMMARSDLQLAEEEKLLEEFRAGRFRGGAA